jgi:hypothetical protein
MKTPGFTAEAAIYNRPACLHLPAVGADRTPGGAVAMALNCPEDCYCLCPQAPATTGGVGGGLKIPVQIPVK